MHPASQADGDVYRPGAIASVSPSRNRAGLLSSDREPAGSRASNLGPATWRPPSLANESLPYDQTRKMRWRGLLLIAVAAAMCCHGRHELCSSHEAEAVTY